MRRPFSRRTCTRRWRSEGVLQRVQERREAQPLLLDMAGAVTFVHWIVAAAIATIPIGSVAAARRRARANKMRKSRWLP